MAANEEDQSRAMPGAMGVTTTDSAPANGEVPAPQASAVAETMPISDVLNTISNVTERPAAAGSSASGTSGREMSLSTLVRLLGLSTNSQVSLLETQVEALTTKVATILLKLDRIALDLGAIKGDAAVDRIDFQITEIRALLKRVVPAAAASGEIETKSTTSKSTSSRAKILTSDVAKSGAGATKKPETQIVEPDNFEEFNKSDDASYQSTEAQRIRLQSM